MTKIVYKNTDYLRFEGKITENKYLQHFKGLSESLNLVELGMSNMPSRSLRAMWYSRTKPKKLSGKNKVFD